MVRKIRITINGHKLNSFASHLSSFHHDQNYHDSFSYGWNNSGVQRIWRRARMLRQGHCEGGFNGVR